MATSKYGVEIPEGQTVLLRLRESDRQTTKRFLVSLLHELRDRIRAVKAAAAASAHAPLTRGRNVVQARLVTDRAMRRSQSAGGRAPHPMARLVTDDDIPMAASSDIGAVDSSANISRIVTADQDQDIPLASLKDDLERKQALRWVMGKTETEDRRSYPGGDPALADQVAKEDVNYRLATDDDETCGQCAFFRSPSGCSRVAGLIRRIDVCDLFKEGRAVEALRVFKATLRKYPR